jgi:uncharacterized protein YjbI with pentapeptide repeats
MANLRNVQRLKRGVEEWNQWRLSHSETHLNLSRADLSKFNLSRANLRGVNLGEANLSGANLSGANLNAADLSLTNLNEADLSRANLGGANLSGATLQEAELFGADLFGADLSFTDFSGANLFGADLSKAILNRAILNRAILNRAILNEADFSEADFSKIQFGQTLFAWVDLSHVRGLDTADHKGPSSVDTKSVIFPFDESTRQHFLRGAGFSDLFIEYLPSLLTTSIQYYSLFISYSSIDECFAKRLHGDLQAKGVRCWFAPHDLRPGIPIVRGIEEAIRLHEKLLLILSEHAINSSWVEREVDTALYQEIERNQDMLFPIRLDNTILESTTGWARRLRHRHIGDFTQWQEEDSYQQAFATLLCHLKINALDTKQD